MVGRLLANLLKQPWPGIHAIGIAFYAHFPRSLPVTGQAVPFTTKHFDYETAEDYVA